MDNVCHTLVGATIAEAGFARRLPRAVLLGVVAANIPDVDALTYVFASSPTAVAFRRGWTHGALAVVVWTALLAAGFAWWNRTRPARGFGAGPASPEGRGLASGTASGGRSWRAADFVLLAGIAVVSHPFFDWMNTYGVRLLMPFSGRWFYGDTLFIVDPTIVAVLGAGWVAARWARTHGRAWSRAPAWCALGLAAVYVGGMRWLSVATRERAVAELRLAQPGARDLMVAPLPLTWRVRDVLVRTGAQYDWKRATWTSAGVRMEPFGVQVIGADSATVAHVQATHAGRDILLWSRFPYFVAGTGADSGTVFVGDARYSSGTTASWAGIRVRVPRE